MPPSAAPPIRRSCRCSTTPAPAARRCRAVAPAAVARRGGRSPTSWCPPPSATRAPAARRVCTAMSWPTSSAAHGAAASASSSAARAWWSAHRAGSAAARSKRRCRRRRAGSCAKLQEQDERARRLASARVDWRDGTTIPFLGETVIVVLDARCTGAVLHTRRRHPARRAAADAARRPAAVGRARADPRRGAELAAAPGPARLRGALPPLRGPARRAHDAAVAQLGQHALGQRRRRRCDPPATGA